MHRMSGSFKVSSAGYGVLAPDRSLTGFPPRLHPGLRAAAYLHTSIKAVAEVLTAHFARPVNPGEQFVPRVWLFP
jgi:hypothetical protein